MYNFFICFFLFYLFIYTWSGLLCYGHKLATWFIHCYHTAWLHWQPLPITEVQASYFYNVFPLDFFLFNYTELISKSVLRKDLWSYF